MSNISDYLPSTTQEGLRVIVHPPSETPFPDTQGQLIKLGTSVDVALRYVRASATEFGNWAAGF